MTKGHLDTVFTLTAPGCNGRLSDIIRAGRTVQADSRRRDSRPALAAAACAVRRARVLPPGRQSLAVQAQRAGLRSERSNVREQPCGSGSAPFSTLLAAHPGGAVVTEWLSCFDRWGVHFGRESMRRSARPSSRLSKLFDERCSGHSCAPAVAAGAVKRHPEHRTIESRSARAHLVQFCGCSPWRTYGRPLARARAAARARPRRHRGRRPGRRRRRRAGGRLCVAGLLVYTVVSYRFFARPPRSGP